MENTRHTYRRSKRGNWWFRKLDETEFRAIFERQRRAGSVLQGVLVGGAELGEMRASIDVAFSKIAEDGKGPNSDRRWVSIGNPPFSAEAVSPDGPIFPPSPCGPGERSFEGKHDGFTRRWESRVLDGQITGTFLIVSLGPVVDQVDGAA